MRGVVDRRVGSREASRQLAASVAAFALAMAMAMAMAMIGCSDSVEDRTRQRVEAFGPLSVYVVNHPLAYFTERIGAAHVEVVFPAPRDLDPAFWMPTSETIAAYQKADLIIENGAGYARWIGQASLPRSRRVDTSAGFRDRWIALERGATHGHGPEGEHSHVGTAFTTWLDPMLAKQQARAIARALISLRPAAQADFEAALSALEADLDALDRALARALEPFAEQRWLFSHPVYQYLARRYSLEGRSLVWEPGEMPDEPAWSAFSRMIEERPARILLFEAEPHAELARRLSAMGIRIIVFEPAGNRPTQGDWLSTMRSNVERLIEAAADVDLRADGIQLPGASASIASQ
jgi:zinc transport system substrate-binding protein